jgi:hypothetical protein
VALDLALRAHEPSEPFGSGPDSALAAELYRDATFWSLVALNRTRGAVPALPALWAAADRALLLRIAGDTERLEQLWLQLSQPALVGYAALSPAERLRVAAELGVFARGMVAAATASETAVQRLRSRRHWRLGLLVFLLGCVLFESVPRIVDRWNTVADLALGKPWRASSAAMQCNPKERRCGNHIGPRIFFHTQNERSPWLELDLEDVEEISSVRVKNRSDCCGERALPLVVELSQDRTTWREVARRKRNFRKWTAKFPAQQARWVRLRVDTTSALHLEQVNVYR